MSILNDWNFWRDTPSLGFARPQYVERMQGLLGTGQIVVITGPRRAGKSVLMRQLAAALIRQGTPKESILVVNWEDPRFTDLSPQTLAQIFDVYCATLRPTTRPYIFLDEVQAVPGWEKWVCTIHELQKATVIVSGSNADVLSQELATVLTGRHVSLTVYPLSLGEYLDFHRIAWQSPLDRAVNREQIQQALEAQLQFGGFPQVVLSEEKSAILLSYFDDILTKDLVRRFRIRKIGELKKLAHFYLAQPASPITFTSAEKFLQMSADTIEKFSGYFATAYLFQFLTRFSRKAKERTKSPRKVYPIDTGLASYVGMRFSQNIGPHAETLVFLELLRSRLTHPQREIYYWKDAQQWEVDFVVKDGPAVTQLIQVCWDVSTMKTQEREERALWKAMTALQLSNGYILTNQREERVTRGALAIEYYPLWKWLLERD